MKNTYRFYLQARVESEITDRHYNVTAHKYLEPEEICIELNLWDEDPKEAARRLGEVLSKLINDEIDGDLVRNRV